MSPRKNTLRSLALNLLARMLAVALVPLVIMAVQGLHCADQAIVDLESSHLRASVKERKARIEDWLGERTRELGSLAACPCSWPECATSLADMSDPHATAFRGLQEYVSARNSAYESIVMFDLSWAPVASTGRTLHMRNEDLAPFEFRRRMELATHAVILPPHFHEGGEAGIHIGLPVTGASGIRIGYVVAAVNLSGALHPILSDPIGLRTSSKVYLLTREGRYVSKPSGEFGVFSAEQGLPDDILKGMGETVRRYRDWLGDRVLGFSAAMPKLGWVLVAEIDEVEVLGWLRILRWRAIGTGLVTLCVVCVLAYFSSHRLLTPLRCLSRTARRIADGHWDERVGHLGGAEPEDVAQAFNSMLDELARVQRRLVQSASLSAIGELSSSIVHEMRNPLSSVKMNLKALREKVAEDATYSELAEIASGQVERLEHMLTDLLQYGKPMTITREALALTDVTEDVLTAIAPLAGAKRVQVSVEDNTHGQKFHADREQMVRAVSNLVDNAIRVSTREGHVVVSGETRKDDGNAEIAISVLDAGPGIPENVRNRLFEPFFSTRNDGTGLGLANVRKIAELHGGRVSGITRPEGGATFTLTLPLGEPA